ncbi:ABC transporter ATP-binding protein [Comamonadaceae bacterium G21597-S1]|nr:ABC transporter ATP-binding protein [Comamonadaceae bacterium G21597-S1]
MTDTVLALRDLCFRWPGNGQDCLQIAHLQVQACESLFLYGPSGCGKSTLLSLMAGVLQPRTGTVSLLDRSWSDMRAGQRDQYRVDHVGYIFQQFNLLPYLSVLDNTMAPCRFSPPRARVAIERSGSLQAAAEFWLGGMGLQASDWLRPARDLSVGQQQRVAAARALIGAPALVIADEPTSALDDDRRNAFVELLLSSCRATRSALVFVSHDRRIAERFDRQLGLPDVNQAQADGADKPLAPDDGEAP